MVTARRILSKFRQGRFAWFAAGEMNRKLQVVGNRDGFTVLTINGPIQSAPIANLLKFPSDSQQEKFFAGIAPFVLLYAFSISSTFAIATGCLPNFEFSNHLGNGRGKIGASGARGIGAWERKIHCTFLAPKFYSS
jgi:hypothetical protein